MNMSFAQVALLAAANGTRRRPAMLAVHQCRGQSWCQLVSSMWWALA
jgi:hypothetical protein